MLAFLKEGTFFGKLTPTAKTLAYGACQYLLILDAFIKPVRPKKLKERVILYLALYERFFMKTAPHAWQNEWIEVAKKTTHPLFVKFLNQYLHKLPETLTFKEEEAYPPFFRNRFPDAVYKAMNRPAPLFVRDRLEKTFIQTDDLSPYLDSDRTYIQNPTPFHLIEALSQKITPPKTILDLCANPGGKTIALHEFFPDAAFFVNDLKEGREMKDNFSRLKIDAHFTQGDALLYPETTLFDLVILDAPCSNSGVLNKRPEARHRLTEASLAELHALQIKLWEKAQRLGKQVAYMTCSILEEENEMPLEAAYSKTILPDAAGLDGGYLGLFISDK